MAKIIHCQKSSKSNRTIEGKEAKWIPLTHMYITARFPVLVQRLTKMMMYKIVVISVLLRSMWCSLAV